MTLQAAPVAWHSPDGPAARLPTRKVQHSIGQCLARVNLDVQPPGDDDGSAKCDGSVVTTRCCLIWRRTGGRCGASIITIITINTIIAIIAITTLSCNREERRGHLKQGDEGPRHTPIQLAWPTSSPDLLKSSAVPCRIFFMHSYNHAFFGCARSGLPTTLSGHTLRSYTHTHTHCRSHLCDVAQLVELQQQCIRQVPHIHVLGSRAGCNEHVCAQ